ncbi:MAG: hypothetical protein QM651_15100 [Rhodoblastus sp.]
MSPDDRTRLRWWLGVPAVSLIVLALTGGGCARNGLGGYELAPIFRR